MTTEKKSVTNEVAGIYSLVFNYLSANPTKWPTTLKQFFGSLPTNFLSVFDRFGGMALEVLIGSAFMTSFFQD